MRTTKIFFLILFFTGCNFNSAPECADEKVKKLVMEIVIDELKDQYLNGDEMAIFWVRGFGDIHTHMKLDAMLTAGSRAQGGGEYEPTYKDLVEHQDDAELFKQMLNHIDSVFADNSDITLESVRIENIDKEIKKCKCSANIVSSENKVPISYTAQYTEEGKVYVSVSGLR